MAKAILHNHEMVEAYFRDGSMPNTWCPGCGLGPATGSMVRAIDQLGLDADKIVIVTGIGCSGMMYALLNLDGFHGTHGRSLPAATGIKLANPELTVIVPMGDGDCAAIGGNHFIQAARRNIDLTVIMVNNMIYGMTGGQVAPTTPRGTVTSTTPYRNVEPPFRIADVVAAAGASYVARWTTFHVHQLVRSIKEALKVRGFSFIEIVSQCPDNYGRRIGLPTAPDFLTMFREHSVPVRRAKEMTEEELEGKFVVGKLTQRKRPEFVCELHHQREELTAQVSKEAEKEVEG